MDRLLCWFCDAPAFPHGDMPIRLCRDKHTIWFLVATYSSWRETAVRIPRCRPCWIGHAIELTLLWIVWLSWPVTFIALLRFVATDPKTLPGIVLGVVIPILLALAISLTYHGVRRDWFGLSWLSPLPRNFALEHPAVQTLIAQGWQRK